MKQQSGFTLIELIAVIVILGIIAAVAVPRFVDLSDAAEQAAVNGIASSLTSGSSLNYAASVANKSGLDTTLTFDVVAECTDAEGLLEGTGTDRLPTDYEITATTLSLTQGDSAECTVTAPNGNTATFTVIGVEA